MPPRLFLRAHPTARHLPDDQSNNLMKILITMAAPSRTVVRIMGVKAKKSACIPFPVSSLSLGMGWTEYHESTSSAAPMGDAPSANGKINKNPGHAPKSAKMEINLSLIRRNSRMAAMKNNADAM